jgi:hypothetical protein
MGVVSICYYYSTYVFGLVIEKGINMVTCSKCGAKLANNKELAWHIQQNLDSHPAAMQTWARKYLANDGKTWQQRKGAK